jgi:hypothetical protein
MSVFSQTQTSTAMLTTTPSAAGTGGGLFSPETEYQVGVKLKKLN